jgi:hypothetical protein
MRGEAELSLYSPYSQCGTNTNMKNFFVPTAEQLLFHYTTAEGAMAILRSKTLRLSEFSMMNDE